MGRSPCCAKVGLNRGAWTVSEDKILTAYIAQNGDGKWRNLPKRAGLKRCGKSCRLSWLNYLRPDIKRGNISPDEEELIVRLHKLLGNRWSLIAGRLPGRTDNAIKNYWNTTLVKRLANPTMSRSTPSTKMVNQRSCLPPRTATRPMVTRAKPNKSLERPFPPPSTPQSEGTSKEVRDGHVCDSSLLDGFITMDDQMLEEWLTTYDGSTVAATEEGKDVLDLESLAILLDGWP